MGMNAPVLEMCIRDRGPTDEVLASGAVGDAFHMDICPHVRLSSMRDEAVAGARAETDRGYVLYPRRR